MEESKTVELAGLVEAQLRILGAQPYFSKRGYRPLCSMARLAPTNDFTERAPEFFAEEASIDCDLCRQTGPQFFKHRSPGIAAIVEGQRPPLTLQNYRACRDALETCPVQAIGYKLF